MSAGRGQNGVGRPRPPPQDAPPSNSNSNDPVHSLRSLASAARSWSDRQSGLESLSSVLSRSAADLVRTTGELEREIRISGEGLEALRSELDRCAKAAAGERARYEAGLVAQKAERERAVEEWRSRAERAEAERTTSTAERDEARKEAERLRKELRSAVEVAKKEKRNAATEATVHGAKDETSARNTDGARQQSDASGAGARRHLGEPTHPPASCFVPITEANGVDIQQTAQGSRTVVSSTTVPAPATETSGTESPLNPDAQFWDPPAAEAIPPAAVAATAGMNGAPAASSPSLSALEKFLLAAGVAPHINGSVRDFATWLAESEDIMSPSDLAEAVQDDDYLMEVLVGGDVDATQRFGVKPYETGQFCVKVLQCPQEGYDESPVQDVPQNAPAVGGGHPPGWVEGAPAVGGGYPPGWVEGAPAVGGGYPPGWVEGAPAVGGGHPPGWVEGAPAVGGGHPPGWVEGAHAVGGAFFPAGAGYETHPQPSIQAPSWSCQACTYQNEGVTLGACAVCGTARQPTYLFGGAVAPAAPAPFAPPPNAAAPPFAFGGMPPSAPGNNAAFAFDAGASSFAPVAPAHAQAPSSALESPSLTSPPSVAAPSAPAAPPASNEIAGTGQKKKEKKKVSAAEEAGRRRAMEAEKAKKAARENARIEAKERKAEEEEDQRRRAAAKEERAIALRAHEKKVKEEEETRRANEEAAATLLKGSAMSNTFGKAGRIGGSGGTLDASGTSRVNGAGRPKTDTLALVGRARASPTRRTANRARTAFSGDDLRLSRMLYPPWKYDPDGRMAASVSRVFPLVQDPKTAEIGREVARREVQFGRLKGEADGLAKRRDAALTQLGRLREDLADVKGENKALKDTIKAIENTAKSQLETKTSSFKKTTKELDNERKKDIKNAEGKETKKWAECEAKRPQRQADAELKEEKRLLKEQFQAERRAINAEAKKAKKKIDAERNATIADYEAISGTDIGGAIQAQGTIATDKKKAAEAERQIKINALEKKEAKAKKELERSRKKRIDEIKAGKGTSFLSRVGFRFMDEETKEEKARIAKEAREEKKKIETDFTRAMTKLAEDLAKDKAQIESKLDMKKEKALSAAIRDREELTNQVTAMEEKVNVMDDNVDAKMEQLSAVREAIKGLKKGGANMNEDDLFHINKRDECGHTLLMVAAQNNDKPTARMCLHELGADANETNSEGLTAMFFADYFKLAEMKEFLAKHKGRLAKQELWQGVLQSKSHKMHRVDWDQTLRVSEKAAVSADTLLASAERLEHDDEWKMARLTQEEKQKSDFSCFDSALIDPESKNLRRTVLLESDVCNIVTADAKMKDHFLRFVQRLKPSHLRREKPVSCHRRAVVGINRPFEVLCAPLTSDKVANDSLVALYSPFVGAESHGVSDVGVLVWAVSEDSNASMLKTLIESAEFKRNKVDNPDDRFPAHREFVLELGREMHLLDLRTTSVLTSSPMELFVFNIDEDELHRLGSKDFAPKKRMVHSEQQMRDALFRTSESEAEQQQTRGILSDASENMSTHLAGGAGTGKTAVLIKKLISEGSEKRMLVVSRLPRLVSSIKTSVEAELLEHNITFSTYEELLTDLARRMDPEDEEERHSFLAFAHVHFGGAHQGSLSSANFVADFVDNCLSDLERKTMKCQLIEPLTLWTAIRHIKANIICVKTKSHMTLDEYLALPKSFGLNQAQRKVVYNLYLRYEEWRKSGNWWDESDRILYVFRHGGTVFTDAKFIPWQERAYQLGEVELLDSPMFYDEVYIDECQDMSETDLALFCRMSASVRSVFFGGDPAQSVEIGIRMRAGTVNDVFNACVGKNVQVKTVLQDIQMRTNHRTHAQNLETAKAVRKILTRSFGVPGNSNENALMNGPLPEALLVPKLKDLGEGKLKGGNIVFITPDVYLSKLRSEFAALGIKNDCFGVVEAKGLEFVSVALVGFFSHFEKLGNEEQWKNVIRWLHSKYSVTKTESGEKIEGRTLEDCDYVLSHPELEDQTMMLYTALTRSREHLYFIEIEEEKKKRKGGKGGLAQFAFYHLKKLGFVKTVDCIDEGEVEMTAQQHKARGVLLVTQAIELSRNFGSTESVKEKFTEAATRFQPAKGNDKQLLDQTTKHLEAILLKRSLVDTMKRKFFDNKRGEYVLDGCFSDIVKFEDDLSKFFKLCMHDPFLVDELHEVRALVEDVFYGTVYEIHFADICDKIKTFEG